MYVQDILIDTQQADLLFLGYYITIPIFKSWPMKKLSNLIGTLWEADPNKPLWSLLAKAWSMIRDQLTKKKAPLDEFFGVMCPWLGLPSPDSYLETYGWTLSIDQDGNPTLSREAGFESAFAIAEAADMALSVEDIIDQAQMFGFATGYKHNAGTASSTFLGDRMAARNARRGRRFTAADLAVKAKLQRDIRYVHEYMDSRKDDPILEMPDYSETLADGSHNPLHDHIVAAVAQGIPGFHDDAPMFGMGTGFADSSTSLAMREAMRQSTMNDAIFYENDAFRLGANEDATLPAFDDANNV